MKSVGLLLLLLAVFIFINASNIRDVMQGKLRLSFIPPTATKNVGTDTKAREG